MKEKIWITIPCTTCGNPTKFLGTKLCDSCWEVECRLSDYLNNSSAIEFVRKALTGEPKQKSIRNYIILGAIIGVCLILLLELLLRVCS